MKDFVGNETSVGDTVVVIENVSKSMILATVVSLHEKTARVEFLQWSWVAKDKGKFVPKMKYVKDFVKVLAR